ncbi:UNVERIFIED_ORG: hypothetical protein M2435_005213 [Rhizobium sophorae]|jgi:hypothetical protein|uniref:Uncharacterized protein n=1 Tax=Rhizobium leguminosarum bv. trifolii TaxID=386 RepID=A0A1C9HQ01_RHILT|nr:hypothetical protein [Rhizobium leguminosarum bv. trifolii]MBB4525153.1 hypothetical protein [Rhizobium leguminosarum]MDH6273348.1 hypothetical protein [Rhizobium leguminosarum]MDH6662290.1 hypothetical protein [Rhizobium sophorae]
MLGGIPLTPALGVNFAVIKRPRGHPHAMLQLTSIRLWLRAYASTT